MRIYLWRAADLARALAQPSGVQRLLDKGMRRVFCRIGPAPTGLAGIAAEHARVHPCKFLLQVSGLSASRWS